MDRLEEYNTKIRDKWIARTFGISYENLMKESFFVTLDEEKVHHVVTFIPSTDIKFLQKCKGYDGTNVFCIINNTE